MSGNFRLALVVLVVSYLVSLYWNELKNPVERQKLARKGFSWCKATGNEVKTLFEEKVLGKTRRVASLPAVVASSEKVKYSGPPPSSESSGPQSPLIDSSMLPSHVIARQIVARQNSILLQPWTVGDGEFKTESRRKEIDVFIPGASTVYFAEAEVKHPRSKNIQFEKLSRSAALLSHYGVVTPVVDTQMLSILVPRPVPYDTDKNILDTVKKAGLRVVHKGWILDPSAVFLQVMPKVRESIPRDFNGTVIFSTDERKIGHVQAVFR